jgi:hypothetical protein
VTGGGGIVHDEFRGQRQSHMKIVSSVVFVIGYAFKTFWAVQYEL